MQVPGKIGWPIVGDKSLEFYRNPVDFLSRNITSTNNKIFSCRFLNKPTVFVCSNEAVREVLENSAGALELGYEQFLGKMFGYNVLFSPDAEAKSYRNGLKCLMSNERIRPYEMILKQILDKRLQRLASGESLCLYKFFKELFTEMCISIFLGIDFTECTEQADGLVALTTSHWHGIVAVPLELKLPGTGTKSTYAKAIEAKRTLLEFIKTHKDTSCSGFPPYMKEIEELDGSAVDHHLLLFSSALVPKILASICTSVCMEVAAPDRHDWQARAVSDDKFLDSLILEVKRLHPPLLGGRRVAKKDCVIGGYVIPKGHAVVYMTYSAHRDSAVFDHPDQFIPSRWEENPDLKEMLFIYGLGPRACIGQELAWLFIKCTLLGFLSAFNVKLKEGQDLSCKHIPVCRPKHNIMAALTTIMQK